MESPDIEKSEETKTQINSNTNCNSKQQSVENANEHPEWLPDGWNMEVRIRKSGVHMGSGYKCYIEPSKGYKFFSKPEVLRYLETVEDSSGTSKKGKKCSKINTPNDKSCTSKEKKSSKMQTPNNKSCSSKKEKKCASVEFPNDNSCTPKEEEKGNNMDFPNNNSCAPKKEKNGSNLDSPNGNSCTSKKEKIGTNMDSPKDSSCTPKKEKNYNNMNSPIDVMIEKSIPEDLPPGWVKELKTTKNGKGIRKDPFYIDPVSGYVFRSKKDVQRYLKSGDIRSCAFKPSRRQIQDEDNITSPPAAKRQKLKQSAPTQQLSAGDSIAKMHSPEDGAANSSEVKKSSDPGRSALLKNESLKESAKALFGDDLQEEERAVNATENGNEKNHGKQSISKIRKEFNVSQRSSPRLAGSKSVQLVNNVINEQTLQVPKRNLRKSRNTLDVDISVDQSAPKEQPHEQETDKIEDNKPEIQISSNKSGKKKEHHLPRRASKRLAAIEHESMNSKVELQQSECGPVTMVADQAPINGKSANKRKKSAPRLKKSGKEEMNDEKTEPQLSFAYHYSWSDPSLEYAINALTGVLPPADNIPSTVAETDIQKPLFDNVTGRSATAIPGTDVQNTSVGNVLRDTTAAPETDIQKASVDNGMGRSTTEVPETDIRKASVDNGTERSTTAVPDTDIQKASIDNGTGSGTTAVPDTDIQKASVDNGTAISTTAVPDTDIQKASVDNGTGRSPTAVPEPDIQSTMARSATTIPDSHLQKTLIDSVKGSSSTTIPENDQKTVIEMESARSTSTGPETDIQKSLIDSVTGSRYRKSQVRSNKPKRTKELKIPVRLSKRLAGMEPELPPAERALEYSTRKSCREEPTATDTLTNGVSDHHNAGEETKPTLLQASDSLKTEVLGESLKRSENSYDAQTDHKEQLKKVEAENVGDVRSEPKLPLPFEDSWSDPCLEFAIKTLTGAFPLDAGGDIMPALPPGFDNPPYKQVHRSVVTDINQEAHDNSNQPSHNKELNMVIQPELRTGSISYENAPNLTTRESYLDQDNILKNLDGEPSLTGNITQPLHHSWNINTLAHEEPLKQNGQPVEGGIVTTEQQLIETGAVNHDNSELQYCAPFMNSWSDPCLEFAFKTLTGVLPVEENLTLQGCFPEPANYHERRDGVSLLPDFRSSSFSQSDFSFFHDTGVKSMPGQQSSVSSSFLPLEKTSLQGFAGVDPQTHFSQCNNNFQRR
ncbi:methyl-CpG-binding domain-containing protein 13-like isoform X2 [Vigna unguiculata]|uniref:methyl-CpG-binding domain-containing protein 13-like isoform X2 n=1 Tax=Vigna unguiculata TaxID=3917 RepID=UPI001016E6B5|nr:methyl-CpG-binding domain-containing protein 13-like isoform X2 [Vigna unguiculata]